MENVKRTSRSKYFWRLLKIEEDFCIDVDKFYKEMGENNYEEFN